MWALTRRVSVGALMVDAFELYGHILWMHHFQECIVGGPPWFREIETSLTDVGNYLYHSYFCLQAFVLMFLACHVFNVRYVKCNVIRHVIYIDSL